MIALIYAHPYPDRSRANRLLLAAVRDLPELELRSLYELYPDFGIDVEAEQELLRRGGLVVLLLPLFWFSVPGLMKHGFDKVLARGFAYGVGGDALVGKSCLWLVTTGGDERAFSPAGMHGHPFSAFEPAIEQTARFCGMRWEPPIIVHGAHRIGEQGLAARAEHYREALRRLSARLGQEARHG
jgi:glutathione-regulated potassium-efflux system ancillary protein KefF